MQENNLSKASLKVISPSSPNTLETGGYTLLYVLEGSLFILRETEQTTYLQSDFTLFIPGSEAAVEPLSPDTRIMLFTLMPDFLADHFDLPADFLCDTVRYPEFNYMKVRELLLLIHDELSGNGTIDVSKDLAKSPDHLRAEGYLYLLLAELGQFKTSYEKQETISPRHRKRVHEMAAYIESHLSETLTLKTMSRAFFMTPPYFSAFFKKQFGMNFKTYLNRKRLYFAARLLRTSGKSTFEISTASGFASASAFRRNFHEEFGMSPAEYRASHSHKQDPVVRLANPNQHMKTRSGPQDAPRFSRVTIQDDFKDPPLRPTLKQKIRVSFKMNEPDKARVSNPGIQMINIGSAQNLQSGALREQLLRAKRELNFKYVRIQELISSSFIPMLLPRYEYHFQNVDAVLSFLYENNLIPFIELTRTASSFNFSQEGLSDIYHIARNSRFFSLIETFLEHVTKRWPLNWLSKWKFEMWMLPRDKSDNYLDAFALVKTLVKRFIPDASLGGPGYNSCSSPMSFRAILAECCKKDVRPDFISVYLHYYEKEPYIHLSTDPDFIIKTLKELRAAADTQFPDTPFYVTEWNSAYIPTLPIGYSRYQAAFCAKIHAQISDECDMSAYWLLSDIPGTAMLLSRERFYYNGQGLFNRENFPTAAYYTFVLISQLGRRMIARGNNYLVTESVPGHYQLLQFHYSHFKISNAMALQRDFDFDQVYEMFVDSPDIDTSFTLTDLEPGLYQITRRCIDAFHGSIFDIMIGEFMHSNIDKIDFLKNMKAPFGAQEQYRRNACVPEERRIYANITGSLELTARLPVHSICMWDIRRQV